jgi:integrase
MTEKLPRGLRIDHGYLQVRIQNQGSVYCKNFGLDTPMARLHAAKHLADKRIEISLGKWGIAPEVPSKKFEDAAKIFYDLWSMEIDPDGMPKHTPEACGTVKRILDKSLTPFFGRMNLETIRPIDVQTWRDRRLKDVLGTSANREQEVLSSMFNSIERWVKTERIKKFKLPEENPCQYIKKAKQNKRERVLSTQELARLKVSCVALNDLDLWEICKMALKSLLRKKDLMNLEVGRSIDLEQSKTGVRVIIPVKSNSVLNYVNFRKRWESARKSAQLEDVEFRDLRKTGVNMLKMKGYSLKLMSEFLGHSNTKTTEIYMVHNADHLKPLAEDLNSIIEAI